MSAPADEPAADAPAVTADSGATAPPRREVLDWAEFGAAARDLAAGIVASGFTVDIVVAVARGGLLPAGAIAYALGAKNCGALNVEFYTGVDERLPEPVILPPLLDRSALAGKNVLLVDDVSDSGRTLALSVDLLASAGASVRSVTLYSKPGTVLEPDFVWRSTADWIVFPWSAEPPVTGAASTEGGDPVLAAPATAAATSGEGVA